MARQRIADVIMDDDYMELPVKKIPYIGTSIIKVVNPGQHKMDMVKKAVARLALPPDSAPGRAGHRFLSDIIPRYDFGIHTKGPRSLPYNMPLLALRISDTPLIFSWHEWSESRQRWDPPADMAPAADTAQDDEEPTVSPVEGWLLAEPDDYYVPTSPMSTCFALRHDTHQTHSRQTRRRERSDDPVS